MDIPALPLAGSLFVLALIDSTSIGTLGLPVWMLARPRVRRGSVLIFLATIGLFYWLLGLALLSGLRAVLPSLEGLGDSEGALWAQMLLGAALFVGSFFIDGPGSKKRRERSGQPSRFQRWQDRFSGPQPSTLAVMALAVAAGVVEAATMIPYLAALGLIATAETPPAQAAVILLGYVAVMLMPAAILLVLRVLFAARVEPALRRLSGWLQRNADSLLGWTVGIAGFLLVNDAVSRLDVLSG